MKQIKLRVLSYNKSFLDTFLKGILLEFSFLHCSVTIVPLPKRTTLFTILRSPFVNAKSKEQFKLESHVAIVRVDSYAHACITLCYALKSVSSETISFKLVLQER